MTTSYSRATLPGTRSTLASLLPPGTVLLPGTVASSCSSADKKKK